MTLWQMRRFRPRTWVSAVAGTGIFGGLTTLAMILAGAGVVAVAGVVVTIAAVAAEWFAWSDAFTRERDGGSGGSGGG